MEKLTLKEMLLLPKKALQGKIIVFPTDTVYGVGALYNDNIGIEKIYQMKKRDYGKPLPVLCANLEQVKDIACFPDKLNEYTCNWPGALTVILKSVPGSTKETIAIRIPNSEIALQLINHFGPLSTTSVNYSSEKELNDINEIGETFSSYIDYLITDKAILSKVPSTIISLTSDEVKVLREGSIKIN